MFPLLLLGAVQLAANYYKQNQEKKYADAEWKQQVVANRRSAIERTLKKPSYLRSPDPIKPPDTSSADTIGGVAQAGQNFNFGAM